MDFKSVRKMVFSIYCFKKYRLLNMMFLERRFSNVLGTWTFKMLFTKYGLMTSWKILFKCFFRNMDFSICLKIYIYKICYFRKMDFLSIGKMDFVTCWENIFFKILFPKYWLFNLLETWIFKNSVTNIWIYNLLGKYIFKISVSEIWTLQSAGNMDFFSCCVQNMDW